MRALRVVGLAEDGKTVICEDSARGEQFELPADERLRAAARGDTARLSQLDSERESQMRPREIQARIRAGESVEQVAAASGMPEQKVERFAYPVLLERSRTAELAQAAHPVRDDGPDTQTLHEALAHAFSLRGQDFTATTWDSWRGDDGKWVVELSWAAGRSDFAAHWAFHPGANGGTVTAIDEHAMELLDPTPTRTLRTVRPVTELAQQALDVQVAPARRVVSAPEPIEERIESPPAARAAQSVAPVEPVAPQPAPEPVSEPEPQAAAAAELDFIDDFELATPATSPVADLADTELADTELADTELADIEPTDTKPTDTELAAPDTEVVDTTPAEATPTEPEAPKTETPDDPAAITSATPAAPVEPAVTTPEPTPEPTVAATPEPEPERTEPEEPAATAVPEPEPAPEIESEPARSEPARSEPAAETTPEPAEPAKPEPAPEPAEPAATVPTPEPAAPAAAPEPKPEPAKAEPEPAEPEPAVAATTTEPAAAAKTESPAAKAEPAEQQLPMEPAAASKPAARPRKGKKGRPIVPSWEDVLLGTRSNRG